MSSRYSKHSFIQPTRSIPTAASDIVITFKQFDNLDTIAAKYYGDPNLSWIIMCANPDHGMEMLIPAGAQIRIPMPLERVWNLIGE